MSTGIGVVGVREANERSVVRPPNESLKEKYIEVLTNQNDPSTSKVELEDAFSGIDVEVVQDLYLSLKHLFTEQCANWHRVRIVQCLLGTSRKDWPELVRLINFIMPWGTVG